MRRGLLASVGWLLAAAVAVGVGTIAVSVVGTGITGGQTQPLSLEAVASALARSGEPTTTEAMTTSPTPPPTSAPSQAPRPTQSTTAAPTSAAAPVTRTLDSPGGGVIATCTGTTVYLDSWTPRQGFVTDDVERGPGATAYVAFDSDDGDGDIDVDITIACEDGIPVHSISTEED